MRRYSAPRHLRPPQPPVIDASLRFLSVSAHFCIVDQIIGPRRDKLQSGGKINAINPAQNAEQISEHRAAPQRGRHQTLRPRLLMWSYVAVIMGLLLPGRLQYLIRDLFMAVFLYHRNH